MRLPCNFSGQWLTAHPALATIRPQTWRCNMSAQGQPSPDLIFDTITAYQKTAAMKAAVDLELFTHLAEGPATAAVVAKRCGASERGTRILCDYMAVHGFLTKTGDQYALTKDTAVFLNR